MSDDTFGYDTDDENDSPLVKNLRTQLREAKKREKDLETEISGLRETVTGSTLEKLFATNEVPEKYQKLFKRGNYEPTSEGMAEFLEEWGEAFGKSPAAPSEEEVVASEAMRKMAEAEKNARYPSHSDGNISNHELAQMTFSDWQKFAESQGLNK